MHRWTLAAAALALAGCAELRVDRAAQVATTFASHMLCDDVFITGADPATALAERVHTQRGMQWFRWAMQVDVDPLQRQVAVSLGGAYAARAAHRAGLGCVALPADEPLPGVPAVHAAPVPEEPANPADPALAAVLADALVDAPGAPPHRTKALLVMHEGRLAAEAYAPGYGPQTPVAGFSATKTVMNALFGALAQQGLLRPGDPAALVAWQQPGDPRAAITVEHLLRQTPGLDLRQDNSGFDANSQILYGAADKSAAAAAAPPALPPGTRWNYTDTNYMLLARVLRERVGDVPAFAQRELFGPLGLRNVHWDFDAAGTAIGAAHLMASARDWARLGQLFLDDGMVGGRRLLPEGWVRWSSTPTLDTGYGAGLWTNRRPGPVPGWGVPWGLPSAPPDAFFARGFMGQFVVVVPSRRLVLVRLAVSPQRGDDIAETDRIVGRVLERLVTAP